MMKTKIIAIDQSTSATKAMLFDEDCQLLKRVNVPHNQYYPKAGWVEHDAEEIYNNTVSAISQLLKDESVDDVHYTLAITNQRETVVVWDRNSGAPVANAVVWQCMRGAGICDDLREKGYNDLVHERSGLLLDPYFSASGVKWILDNIDGARGKADNGDLLMGTIDAWLIWRLTRGEVHATDYTNASRTMLFNIHTLDWDDDLLELFTIPRNMMPQPLPCDSVFGRTTVEGLFDEPITIAGVMGDSHGALAGQMCFKVGLGKATYGTGSSVMMNIGEKPLDSPQGLVTSIGFSALGKTFYAFEGNVHCTGATIKWLAEKMQLINSPSEIEAYATSVSDNGGVYFVPAFAGLGAPWWNANVKACIQGMTLGSTKAHILRAALEAIAYQVKDLVDMMSDKAGVKVTELRVDGGPTKNNFLMQFQADMLGTDVSCSDIEEASALGAVIMNGFARKVWTDFDAVASKRKSRKHITPTMHPEDVAALHSGWLDAVHTLIGK